MNLRISECRGWQDRGQGQGQGQGRGQGSSITEGLLQRNCSLLSFLCG